MSGCSSCKKTIIRMLFLAAVLFPVSANAEFRGLVDVPSIPSPPEIEFISEPILNNSDLNIFSEIIGQSQMQVCCDGVCTSDCYPNCDFDCDYENNLYYGESLPQFSYGPACIPADSDSSGGLNTSACSGFALNPVLTYYLDNTTSQTTSVQMDFSADTGRFAASIDTAGIQENSLLTYFITAADNAGNVVSQKTGGDISPCMPGVQGQEPWEGELETPAFDNCSYSSVTSSCGTFSAGVPSCGAGFTVNDPSADTCFSESASQDFSSADILGFSAAAGFASESRDEKRICARVGLSAPPQDVIDDELIIYVLYMYNPGRYDFNPFDPNVSSAYFLTYIPGMANIDPSLVSVLWDSACMTHSDIRSFDDINYCAIARSSDSDNRVMVRSSGNNLYVEIQDTPDKNAYLFDDTASDVIISAASFSGDLSGDQFVYTLLDTTPALRLINKKNTIDSSSILSVPPPLVDSPAVTCMQEEAGQAPAICGGLPGSFYRNDCMISIYPFDGQSITGYNIYASRENEAESMQLVQTINAAPGTSPLTWNYTVTAPDLDGGNMYFRVTGVSTDSETPLDRAAQTYCRLQDDPWAGMRINNFSCSAPRNLEHACNCTWSFETEEGENPALYDFYSYVDGTLLNQDPYHYDLVNGDQEEYRFLEFDSSLEYGHEYTFSVQAISPEDVESGVETASCVPEDRKSKCVIAPGIMNFDPEAHTISFPPCASSDMAEGSYNIYSCGFSDGQTDRCMQLSEFTVLNSTPVPEPAAGSIVTFSSGAIPDTDNVCFFIDACDSCVARGTCPSNNGTPNCSSSKMSPSMIKCISPDDFDPYAPLFPDNISVSSNPAGSVCDISWDRVCEDTGGPFANCDSPTPDELTKYYIFRGESKTGDCTDTSIVAVPALNSPVETVYPGEETSFADNGLVNGNTFCYSVIAADISMNYSSSQPVPVPGACTPMDITPPPSPQVDDSVVNMEPFPCSPSWFPVADKDKVSYNVYRCNSLIQACSLDDFQVITGTADRALSDITDPPIVDEFTHCVTAMDPAGNESSVFETGGQNLNCLSCSIDYRPEPPQSIVAGRVIYEEGIRLWWNASASDNAQGTGYNIYVCQDRNTMIDECFGPLPQSPAAGEHSFKMGQPALVINEPDIEAEGFFYITLTYVNHEGLESLPAFSREQVYFSSRSCDIAPIPDECSITVELQTPLSMHSVVSCVEGDSICYSGKYRIEETGIENVIIDIIDVTTGETIISRPTDATGNIEKIRLSPGVDINSGGSYSIRARIPGNAIPPAFTPSCSNFDTLQSDGFCNISLSGPMSLNSNQRVSARTPLISDSATGGYGGEMGNPNGDGQVNMYDIASIKHTMNTRPGDTCYRAWADLNLDGKINMFDLTVIKSNMGIQFDTNDPDFDPVLTEKSEPLDLCCINGSCK